MPSKKKTAPKTANKPKAKTKPKAPSAPKGTAKPAAKPKATSAPKSAKVGSNKSASPAAKANPKRKGANGDLPHGGLPDDKAPRVTVRGLITDLIVGQDHTDDEILANVQDALPDSIVNKNIIGACRSELNSGKRLPPSGEKGKRFEQIVSIDGKKMPKSEKPRPERAARPRKAPRSKVDPANDPLSRIGIAPVAKKKPARKATATA